MMRSVQGEPLRRPGRGWFDAAVSKAKLDGRFTWHCLRHTFASRLVMAQVDILIVQELMGHKTTPMTLRHAHSAPAHTLEAVNRMAEWSAERLQNKLTPAPLRDSKTSTASTI